MITGDSFSEGYSVKQNESVSFLLNKANYKTISLGKAGFGSLFQLASIKEYAEPIQPKILLWFFFYNDLDGLKNEMNSDILLKYLNNKNFTQNLINKQEIIKSKIF